MWQANITHKQIVSGQLVIEVKITDGVNTYIETFYSRSGVLDIKNQVLARIEELKKIQTSTINEGTLDLTPDTVVPPPDPTPEELAKQEFFKDYKTLCRLMSLVNVGVFTGTETQIVNLRNKLKANFKTEYLNGL